ncbi:MAG: hypothetical protein N3A69_11835, partial [Leptospiraceae bacterium]|nr:hypothetical protein [Leptospiraceae bacterium]
MKIKLFFYIFVINITVLYAKVPEIGYIYINANSGQSSGGHSAFLIGKTVYHFQLFSDGIFHLVREPFESFRTIYGDIENRSIFIHILDLDQKKAEQVLEFWNLTYIEQQAELKELESLENYLFLINQIANSDNSANTVINLNLPSLGYFNLKSKNNQNYLFIKKKFNNEYLEKLLADWKNFIKNNELNSLQDSKLFLNAIYHTHALETILSGNGLEKEAYFEVSTSNIQVDTSIYFQKLKNYQSILEQNILEILKNPSSNDGRAFVTSLARWC